MNDDLISRKELIERIAKQYDLQYGNNSFGRIIDCIKAQPAAYDAEYDKLKHYENLEEQGRLTILPCKVGDTIYTYMYAVGWHYREKKKPYEAKIAFIGINGKDNFVNAVFKNGNMLQFLFSDFGKLCFTTKEEYEKSQKEGC